MVRVRATHTHMQHARVRRHAHARSYNHTYMHACTHFACPHAHMQARQCGHVGSSLQAQAHAGLVVPACAAHVHSRHVAMDSDVDIEGVLSAAAALPRAAAEDDSDHDLADVLAAVSSLDMQRAQFARRSHLLMKHARACKELARAKRGLQVADHVLQRIEVHNQDMAKTREDIIDVTEKVPVKHRGKGSYRHWVPSALLRVCWGLKPRLRILKNATHRPRRRLQGKRCVPRAVAPTVASARTCAACWPWCFGETTFGWFRFGRVLGMKRVS